MTIKELENYKPKGQLEYFPKEIIARMLEHQEEQGYPRDVSVFEKRIFAGRHYSGFDWGKTEEKDGFWSQVISLRNFDLFFERYPKKDNQDNQEFKVGDEVYDIIYGKVGVIKHINLDDTYSINVIFNDNQMACFTLDGKYCSINKRPSLLHYRDDYNYDVIDFNNLPKRQEPKI